MSDDRGYAEQLWCVKKHSLSALGHLEETLEKLSRECSSSCSVSYATRIECEQAIKNIINAEEHISEILKQKDIKELVEIMNEFRLIRQKLAMTKLPFRSNLEIERSAVDVIVDAIRRTDEQISKIDRYAVEMKQELSSISCPRCSEDLIIDAIVKKVRASGDV